MESLVAAIVEPKSLAPSIVEPEAEEDSPSDGELRGQFWAFYVERFPAEGAAKPANKAKSRWTAADVLDLEIAQFLGRSEVGVFVRGPFRELIRDTAARLRDNSAAIDREFPEYAFSKITAVRDGLLFVRADGDLTDRRNWPWMAEWLLKHRDEWCDRLQRALAGS